MSGWTHFCPQSAWGSSFANESARCQTPAEKDALTSMDDYMLRAILASQQPTHPHSLLISCVFCLQGNGKLSNPDFHLLGPLPLKNKDLRCMFN